MYLQRHEDYQLLHQPALICLDHREDVLLVQYLVGKRLVLSDCCLFQSCMLSLRILPVIRPFHPNHPGIDNQSTHLSQHFPSLLVVDQLAKKVV